MAESKRDYYEVLGVDKNADDSGTGVNDGIEDSNVIIQDPNDFWTVSLN